MTSPTAGTILFQDNFSNNGPLNSSWDFNHWFDQNTPPPGTYTNPSYLGQTQMRQSVPNAADGMAKIRLDTFNEYNTPNKPPGQFNSFTGSEAITKQAWAADATGGIAFEGTFRLPSTQGGMIAGFFGYQDFGWPPSPPKPHASHDEIDFEILTTQLAKVSTNVFTNASGTDAPISEPVATNSFQQFHTYRMEWYLDSVLWFVDGALIRSESRPAFVPSAAQQLHMNLWGVPGGPVPPQWLKNPGDPDGPNVGDPSFQPAATQAQNQTYYFDVSNVKVERLPVRHGTNAADVVTGSAASEHIGGAAAADILNGMAGDDVLVGGQGNDSIDGGAGSDTVLFSGARSNYAATAAGAVTTIADTRPGAEFDGSDSLTGVEYASFSDGLYAIGTSGVLTPVPVVIPPSSFVERVLQADAYVARQGSTLSIGQAASVLSNDDGASVMTASVINGPAHGTLALAADGTFTYTPTAGFRGPDSFIYAAADDAGVIGEAEVMLYVTPVSGGTLNLPALTTQEKIAAIYTGLLGRGADRDGFIYWADVASGGASLQRIAGDIGASAEAKANLPFLANPEGASDAQIGSFVDAVFVNLFGNAADSAGKAYWTNEVKQAVSAGQAPASVVATIISGTQDPGISHEVTTLMNKVAVNLYYVYQQALYDISVAAGPGATVLLANVTSAPETVLAGLKQADPLVFSSIPLVPDFS